MTDQLSTNPASISPAKLDRTGAVAGIAFAVLGLAGAFSVPLPPAVDDPASEIRDYVVDHKTALGVSTVLYAASILAFIGFVAMVHRRLTSSSRSPLAAGTFLVAGTAGITLGLLGSVIEAALVQRIGPVSDQATVATWFQIWDLVAFAGPPLAINLAIAVAAWVLYRDRVFPRWLAPVAAASVIVSTIGLVIDLAGDGVVPAAVDFGGFMLANVWIVGISVTVLLRSRSRSHSAAEEASALGAATSARPVTA
jgi:hypothetical protein